MVEICKTCGAVIPEPHFKDPHDFTSSERTVYNFIAKNPGVIAARVRSHLYGNRSDGGPLYNAVAINVHHINKKLIDHKIEKSGRAGETRYTLVKIEKGKAK